MNLSEEIIKAIILVAAGIVQVLALIALATGLKMYIDNISLRKGQRIAFSKIRALELKVFGQITSELDSKKLERSEER